MQKIYRDDNNYRNNPRKKYHIRNRRKNKHLGFFAIFALVLTSFSGIAAQPTVAPQLVRQVVEPIQPYVGQAYDGVNGAANIILNAPPQLVRQVVEPIEPYLGPAYDGVNGAANLIIKEVPHLTLPDPFPLNHVHIDDGGLGEFLHGISFSDHGETHKKIEFIRGVSFSDQLEPFPLDHVHIDDGGLGEFLQGVDFVDKADDAINAADLADDAINAADLADDVVNGAGAAATGVVQGLMDKVPWTDISPQNIIGELGEKCLRSKNCYEPIIELPVPNPVGGSPGITIVAPLAGAFSGYMKAKETGSFKAGFVKGTVVTGTNYLISTYLSPVCLADPEPASKVVCFGILAGFSYFGGSVGDTVADSFIEPKP